MKVVGTVVNIGEIRREGERETDRQTETENRGGYLQLPMAIRHVCSSNGNRSRLRIQPSVNDTLKQSNPGVTCSSLIKIDSKYVIVHTGTVRCTNTVPISQSTSIVSFRDKFNFHVV